jgi:hypothetical protein
MCDCGTAFMCLERPIVFGALKEVQKQLGKDNFPLIPQTYYPVYREMLITPDFPAVCKVSKREAKRQSITSTIQLSLTNSFA